MPDNYNTCREAEKSPQFLSTKKQISKQIKNQAGHSKEPSQSNHSLYSVKQFTSLGDNSSLNNVTNNTRLQEMDPKRMPSPRKNHLKT